MEMGSDEDSSYDLSLLNSSDDYILSNSEIIYPVLKKYLSCSTDEHITTRVLELAFGPCLTLFKTEELEENLLRYACPVAQKHFTRLLDRAENVFRNDNTNNDAKELCICRDILSQLNDAVKCILSDITAVKIVKVRNLLLCTSAVLYETYKFCHKYENWFASHPNTSTDGVTLFMKIAQELQSNLLQLLSKIEMNYEEYETNILNETLTNIYQSGMILLNLDVKAMADIWKGYICVIGKYSEHLKAHHQVSVPLGTLSSNLVNNLENFILKNSLECQNFEKTVKILCFILKVIIKLVEKFSGSLGKCQNALIYLLIALNKISDPHILILKLSMDKAECLKSLVIGIDPLLNYLINNEDFAQEFCNESKTVCIDPDRRFGFVLLSCQILKKLTLADGKTRRIWFNSDINILNLIFHNLTSCNFEFSLDLKFPGVLIPGKTKKMTDCFEYLLTHISTFLLVSSSKEFFLAEKTLLKYIIQPNPWCSLLATDILCLVARFADAELCFKQVNNLCRLLIQFEKWPLMPEKLFLESAVGRLYPVMSQKHRDLFLELYPPQKYCYLWNLFGFQHLSKQALETVEFSIENLAVFQTNRFLSCEDFEERDFVEMEYALYGLNVRGRNINIDGLENNLVKLWKINYGKLITNPLGKRYLKSICAATRSIMPYMASQNMLLVLHGIKVLLPNLGESCSLYCLHSLDRLGKVVIPQGALQSSTFKVISSLFKDFLTSKNIIIQTRSTEVFVNFASVTSHTQIIKEFYNYDRGLQKKIIDYLQKKYQMNEEDWSILSYIKKIEILKYEHVCNVINEVSSPSDDCEPPIKKASFDDGLMKNKELENIISLLKKEVVKLNEHSNELTFKQRKEISSITDILLKMLG